MATNAAGGTDSLLDLCDRADVSDNARQLVRSEMSAAQLVAALFEADLGFDAAKVVAHAFPARVAIWWGAMCLEHASNKHDRPEDVDALETVVRWVLEPSETQRRLAEQAGDKARRNSASGMLARAVFYTGGSISRPGLPNVDPPEDAYQPMVAMAVRSAANRAKKAERQDRWRDFLRLAIEVAEGRHLWTLPKKKEGS